MIASDRELAQAYDQGWQDGRKSCAWIIAEATEVARNAQYQDGYATCLTQDLEALEDALAQVAQDQPTKGE